MDELNTSGSQSEQTGEGLANLVENVANGDLSIDLGNTGDQAIRQADTATSIATPGANDADQPSALIDEAAIDDLSDAHGCEPGPCESNVSELPEAPNDLRAPPVDPYNTTRLGFPVMPNFADERLIPAIAFAGPVTGALADIDFDTGRGRLLLMRAEAPAHLDPIEYVLVGNQLQVARGFENVLAVRHLHGPDTAIELRARAFGNTAPAAVLHNFHTDLTALTRSRLDEARLMEAVATTFGVENKIIAAEADTTESQVSKKRTAVWTEERYPEAKAAVGAGLRVTFDYLYHVGRAFRTAEKADAKSGATGKASEVAKLKTRIAKVAAKAAASDKALTSEEALVALALKQPTGSRAKSPRATRAPAVPALKSEEMIAGADDTPIGAWEEYADARERMLFPTRDAVATMTAGEREAARDAMVALVAKYFA